MGMQGPLTAQALGRSPYDEVVDGEGPSDTHEPHQQYDSRGRPINPETKRINRDIIRSHNEVMLVIGVAEPENQQPSAEVESQRQHEAHEDKIGERLMHAGSRAIEIAGLLGLHSLRQRILIYKDHSEFPFWKSFRIVRNNFSLSRDILAGVPAGIILTQTETFVSRLWAGQKEKARSRRIVNEFWSYVRVHLELYMAFQRVGLVPANQILPKLSFFIPFSSESPIPSPGHLNSFTLPSVATWLAGAIVSASPFLVWVMTRRLLRDWRPPLWSMIYQQLPSTAFRARRNAPPSMPPPPPPPPAASIPMTPPEPDPSSNSPGEWIEVLGDGQNGSMAEGNAVIDRQSIPTVRRQSVVSARGDEYVSDEEEPETVTATLISLDIEATDHDHDAPPGLWSAELRPSLTSDTRARSNPPVFLDTQLTRLPAVLATSILTDAALRLLISPYEAIALRFAAQAFSLQHGIPCPAIYNISPLRGMSWVSVVNLLGVEFLHFSVLSDIWAIFTALSEYFHMTEDEWKTAESEGGK